MAIKKRPEEGLKFEEALGRLEKIVNEMEAAELPLEEILKQYEDGTQLVAYCTQKLSEAEQKIEILARKKDGTREVKPFGTTVSAEETQVDEISTEANLSPRPKPKQIPDTKDGEISLF